MNEWIKGFIVGAIIATLGSMIGVFSAMIM